jgi:transcriptional regulator with XRE-family HTH domain
MPSRTRTVGPEASEYLADLIKETRLAQKLSMPKLSAKMYEQGFEMSAATINAIENGIALGDHRRTRLITVDELKAFAKVLQIPPQDIINWLYDQQ